MSRKCIHCGDHEMIKEGWHLDKKIPLSIILALLIQTAVLLMWGARLEQRVTTTELTTANHTIVIEAMRSNQSDTKATLARIDERLAATSDGVKEIKAKLDGSTTRITPRKSD